MSKGSEVWVMPRLRPHVCRWPRRDDFQAWVQALDMGIDRCVDPSGDWFPGVPDDDDRWPVHGGEPSGGIGAVRRQPNSADVS